MYMEFSTFYFLKFSTTHSVTSIPSTHSTGATNGIKDVIYKKILELGLIHSCLEITGRLVF